jgi:hypothetical protein
VLGLAVEDLTITGQNFLDVRQGLLTLTLRRCRAAGFNTGAGGSSLFDVRSANLAVYAEQCVFDGTVGRSPDRPGPAKHGTPFSLSATAKLLRFDGCTFIGNSQPVRLWGTATVQFHGCTFRGNRTAVVTGAQYQNCTFEGNDDVRDGSDPAARWTAEERTARLQSETDRQRAEAERQARGD